MELQTVIPDKAIGIVNDANLRATESMGNAKDPFELFLRVLTISLETPKLVRLLPPLDLGNATPPKGCVRKGQDILESEGQRVQGWMSCPRSPRCGHRHAEVVHQGGG